MGYPASVDTGQVAPFYLMPDGALSAGAGGAIVAGSAYAYGITLSASITVTQMRTVFSGAPTGNCDMGIYDATGANAGPGNLLGHTGAIVTATGMFTQALTANLLLSPGQYWLAILNTIANSVWLRAAGAAGVTPAVKTTSTALTVLPATFGALTDSGNILYVEALLLGSYA